MPDCEGWVINTAISSFGVENLCDVLQSSEVKLNFKYLDHLNYDFKYSVAHYIYTNFT